MRRITSGMVLAAGLGLRMRPLTEGCPKALVVLHGETLLDHALARFREAGVTRIVVNAHYLGDMVRKHLATLPDVVISDETDRLLDTGGGVRNALAMLGNAPFIVANCDSVWLDGAEPALRRLSQAWDDAAMDALLLLHPIECANGYSGAGDFRLDPHGRVARRGTDATAPFIFTGVQILRPDLFAGTPEKPFSLNIVYDKAASGGRLFGLVHDGDWFHVGTPADLAATERAFDRRIPAGQRSPGASQ